VEAAAQAYLDEIDEMGGAIAAIDSGYQQRHIQDAAYRVQREIESADRIVVGVNRFTDDETVSPPLQRIDPALEREQIERITALRASRDEAAWSPALDRLEVVARGTDNIVPVMIEAVKAQATLGEISDRLRDVWGEHRELVTV
jgi:methylmalonyl-CoA mutase N-terminal domain/subunit